MPTRNMLPIAFGSIVLVSVAGAIYGAHAVSSLGSPTGRLNDGSAAVSSARSAQLDFARLRNPIDRAILTREMTSEADLASFESGRQQLLSDLQVAHERMLAADSGAQIEKTKALADTWFAMAMKYLQPSAGGVLELPTPAALVAKGDEVMSATDLTVEAASAYESDVRARAGSSTGVSRANLIVLNILAVVAGMIAAAGMAYSLRRDQVGQLLGSLAKTQSAMREANETRERERMQQLATLQAQIEEDRVRRQARA